MTTAVATGATPGDATPRALALTDVAVERGGRIIWSEGTFAVPTGATVAVIGPNGSGKSTLLQVLLGLLRPATGTVRVFGEAPHRGNRRVGYVPQRAAAIGDLVRCRDVVALGLSGHRWGTRRLSRDERAQVDATIAAVGAESYAGARFARVSGGQQQRIAIAQALVGRPELLLLDEPLSNLDVKHRHEIVELLAELQRNSGITVLIVTHDLSQVLPIATSAVYLLDGHAHYDEIGNVVDADLLAHLYGTAVRIVRTPQGDLFASGS